MWKCPACGKENENLFCSSCGCKKPEEKQSQNDYENILGRGFLFLEDGDFEKAEEYFEKVLDIDFECAKAYLGKLLVSLKVKKIPDLEKVNVDFSENPNYKKIVRFGDEKLINEVNIYLDAVTDRVKSDTYEPLYLAAKEFMENNTIEAYETAINYFSRLNGYKDSVQLMTECDRKISEIKMNESDDIKKIMMILLFFGLAVAICIMIANA